jgi:hypothetical protein
LALLTGCAASAPPRPAPDIVESGFLTNYDLLTPSPGNRAQLVYHRPKTDISQYKTIWFNRVHLWRTRGDGFGDINNDELQRLADDLYFAVRSQLAVERTELGSASRAFVESALIELEINDASSQEVLLATVDRNIGRPASNGSLTSTADVNEAFNIWAERIAKRLRERRSGKRRR